MFPPPTISNHKCLLAIHFFFPPLKVIISHFLFSSFPLSVSNTPEPLSPASHYSLSPLPNALGSPVAGKILLGLILVGHDNRTWGCFVTRIGLCAMTQDNLEPVPVTEVKHTDEPQNNGGQMTNRLYPL